MILLRIALRNVLATPIRTLIIGLLVVFGTTLVVVGGALLSALDRSMARSIIGSVSGHLQVSSADARDAIDLFNAPTGTPDLGRIEDFGALKVELARLPGVEAVIPMGTDFATVFSGNLLDVKLGELRRAWAQADRPRARVVAEHVRSMVSLLREATPNLAGFVRVEQLRDDALVRPADLERALSDGLWQELEAACAPGPGADPAACEQGLEFLENRVAPLAMDESMLFLRYIGTDPQAFAATFDMFEVVDGQMIPPGQRGFLFAKNIYERQVKHPVARRFDQIREKRERGRTLADDPELRAVADRLPRLTREVVLQLDGPAREQVTAALRQLLGDDAAELSALVTRFLTVDDATFDDRYAFFYETIAPHLVLYKVRVGDTLTIRSVTRSGYMTAVNVKVWGTYRFRGLEKSMLAGVYNVMDLMTFRDLYGDLTEDRREELAQLQQASGAKAVDRARAEDELFGGGEAIEQGDAERPEGFDEFAGIDMADGGRRYDQALASRVYTKEEIEAGVVIQAALRLDGVERIPEARAAVEALSKEKGLGLRVADWREVSGLVGKFIGVIWIVLVTAIVIIFLVALVIINNSMVLATLDRTREIGAMRAMGAQKRTILALLLLESVLLGAGFGLVGVGLGSGVVLVLGQVGIPAFTDELYFLFAGPRLLPALAPEHFAVAFAVVLLVTVVSVISPARLAMRVQPVEAMGKED